MIHDDLNRFNDAQVIGATAVSTDVIDLSADRNLGIGEAMSILFLIAAAAKISAADETYSFELETSVDEAFTTPISVVKRDFTTAQATADLLINAQVVLAIPQDTRCERYLRTKVTTGGSSPAVTYTSILQPTHGVGAEVRGGYANNSTIN